MSPPPAVAMTDAATWQRQLPQRQQQHSGSDSGSDDDTADAGGGRRAGRDAHGFGVDAENKVIRVGLNADLSGTFAALTCRDRRRYRGLLGALQRSTAVQRLDSRAGRARQLATTCRRIQNYDALRPVTVPTSVFMLTNSTGSPHTAAIRRASSTMTSVQFRSRGTRAGPIRRSARTSSSGRANYCIESMNGVTYMSRPYGNKMAIVSWPGRLRRRRRHRCARSPRKRSVSKSCMTVTGCGHSRCRPDAGCRRDRRRPVRTSSG